jgi:polyisoprenoid-binding protein YceI
MTNYLASLAIVAALCSAACSAAESPAPAKAAVKPAAKPAAAPAAAVTVQTGAARYLQAPGSSLTFTFTQADATNKGAFEKFSTELVYDEKNLAAGKLDVTVQIGSLATQDKDRDDTLKSADLLDASKYPTAHYSAAALTRNSSGGIDAAGKLTLHGVTRDLRVPLKVRATANGLEISGETTLKRLDFGIGQGDWKSTEMVGDVVKLQFKVLLSRSS